MLKKVTLIFVVAIAMLVFAKEYTGNDPLVKTLHTLEGEERDSFLLWELANGFKQALESEKRSPKFDLNVLLRGLNISDEDTKKFSKMTFPKESRLKLYTWTKNQFNMTTNDVLNLLRTRKCPPRTCPKLPDVGELCCPW